MAARPIIHLDTNAILYLFKKKTSLFSANTLSLLEVGDVYFSPMVRLEFRFLESVGKISSAKIMVEFMLQALKLKPTKTSLGNLIYESETDIFTRDVFDLFITADAKRNSAYLVTSDRRIQNNYDLAIF